MKRKIMKIVAAAVVAVGLSMAGIGSAVFAPASSDEAAIANAGEMISGVGRSVLMPAEVAAKECAGAQTSIIECNPDEKEEGGGIFVVINIVLNVLTFGVGIAGTLGIVITGVMYLTARDNEAQMTKAKSRLINIVIGLAAYAVMWAFLQWLLPGGIFGR